MSSGQNEPVWNAKGATLSEKTAQREYGLTHEEVDEAIRSGRLQFRHTSIHGNPCLRLLRAEVEALVAQKHGHRYLQIEKLKVELAAVDKELRTLKKQMSSLEERRTQLRAALAVADGH